MQIHILDNTPDHRSVAVGEVIPGSAIIKYQGHHYHIMKDVGTGIHINIPEGLVLLINISTGGLRAINSDKLVSLLRPLGGESLILEVVPMQDREACITSKVLGLCNCYSCKACRKAKSSS